MYLPDSAFTQLPNPTIPSMLQLVSGMPVQAPVITLDEDEDTIVALQMLGSEQAVKSNWAALMGGGKINWINSVLVKLNGSRDHITLRQTLPCGWLELWLIHKQASAQLLNPERPFYFLHDATNQPVAHTFFILLNKALQTPMLPDWTEYLWTTGRSEHLIRIVTNYNSRGRAAWRIIPDTGAWNTIITHGLQNGRISF
ncbi:MAG: hypothetical protein KDD10_21475 [Phaeodactylibacter sp.]|nr:hypothetical protein [Phaeodactylibacter sp.]